MGLSRRATERIQRLIEFRSLHAVTPVPIRQIINDEGWRLLFREQIHPLYGFAVIRGQHKIMTVSADVSYPAQRYVMAHELAHEINEDPGILHVCGEGDWLESRSEREADEIAAWLLIPDSAMERYTTAAAIAAACQVPERLVRIRAGLLAAH